MLCKLTGGISARSGTSAGYGYGVGTIQTGGGTLADTAWTVTLYNSAAGAISQFLSDGTSTKYVQAKYLNGLPFVDVDDCN